MARAVFVTQTQPKSNERARGFPKSCVLKFAKKTFPKFCEVIAMVVGLTPTHVFLSISPRRNARAKTRLTHVVDMCVSSRRNGASRLDAPFRFDKTHILQTSAPPKGRHRRGGLPYIYIYATPPHVGQHFWLPFLSKTLCLAAHSPESHPNVDCTLRQPWNARTFRVFDIFDIFDI